MKKKKDKTTGTAWSHRVNLQQQVVRLAMLRHGLLQWQCGSLSAEECVGRGCAEAHMIHEDMI